MKSGASKATNRKRYKALEPRYKIYHKDTRCFYCCTEPANGFDHVPALSVAHSFGSSHLINRGVQFHKVSACQECNSALGDRPLMFLRSRTRFIYRYLQRRYKKIVSSPNWYKEDSEDFGKNLKDMVDRQNLVKNWIIRRLEAMEDIHRDWV